MPWIAPTVGYVDNLGYLRCSDCADEDKREHAVAGDQYFGADDVCERCGHQLEHVKTAGYVHVGWHEEAPDIKR